MAAPASVKSAFEGVRPIGRKKIVVAFACVLCASYLYGFYNLFLSVRLGRMSNLRAEIADGSRALEVVQKNLEALEKNLESLGAAAERYRRSGAASVSDMPDAIINVSRLMVEAGVTEKDFTIKTGAAYGDGVYRRPISVSGEAAFGDALLFIESLRDGRFKYELTGFYISGGPHEKNEPVMIGLDLDILVFAD